MRHEPIANISMNNDLARYHRQMLLPGMGERGQRALLASHALVVGCGALGTVIADALARAGVGTLTIVDRDVVELTNLQRQVLFDEEDVREGRPKAAAAQERLKRINSGVVVHARVEDVNHTNIERLAAGAHVILDGLDNFQTRYLLNDLSVKRCVPYLYGGAVGVTGMACMFTPSRTDAVAREGGNDGDAPASDGPCLRCLFPEAPPPGTTPTCDTAGVLAAAVATIAHHQVAQAIKWLSGNAQAIDPSLLMLDVWRNELRRLDVSAAKSPECPCCGQRRFDYLEGSAGASATSLCGRGAVQINPALDGNGHADGGDNNGAALDLSIVAARLAPHGEFKVNDDLLRGTLRHERGDEGRPIELTLFVDGRAIISGTARPDLARTIYDRYVGG